MYQKYNQRVEKSRTSYDSDSACGDHNATVAIFLPNSDLDVTFDEAHSKKLNAQLKSHQRQETRKTEEGELASKEKVRGVRDCHSLYSNTEGLHRYAGVLACGAHGSEKTIC